MEVRRGWKKEWVDFAQLWVWSEQILLRVVLGILYTLHSYSITPAQVRNFQNRRTICPNRRTICPNPRTIWPNRRTSWKIGGPPRAESAHFHGKSERILFSAFWEKMIMSDGCCVSCLKYWIVEECSIIYLLNSRRWYLEKYEVWRR